MSSVEVHVKLLAAIAHLDDMEVYQARVLIEEVRRQVVTITTTKEKFRDDFAMAAISGFSRAVTDYGWDDEIMRGHLKTAYRMADLAWEIRKS